MDEAIKERFRPLADGEWPAEVAAMRDGFAGRLDVYRVMARHPALLRAWGDLRQHVVLDTVLGRQRSEIVILRVGARLGAAYEWAHHVVRGREVGLDDRRIAALKGAAADVLPEDRVLVQAVDELLDHAAVGPATLAALEAEVGQAGVLDVMATIGFYSTLGFIVNSFATPVDRGVAAALEARPLQEG